MMAPAQAADLPAITALLKLAGLCHDDLTSEHMDDFLTIEEDGEPIGAVGLEVFGPDALLRSLVVAPTKRGKNLGGQLVESIEAHARQQHVQTLYLLTTTADRFFERRGYLRTERRSVPESIGATTEFVSFCPESAIAMMKRLG